MSKKRKRDGQPVDLSLAAIYDQLAHEDESKRLEAARQLITKVCDSDVTSTEQVKKVLNRLIRGLCSGRKAARLGFSVALTELLSQPQFCDLSNPNKIPVSVIVDLLDSQTVPEGNTSGQDERDHYFGRLFGAEAVIKSLVLVEQQSLLQWKRLLDLVCGIASKKPWLRQECGWILFNFVKSETLSREVQAQDFAVAVVDKMTEHKLIRTPEGVAIWLGVDHSFPHAKLPKHVWKHRDPLNLNDISTLRDVMKDAKAQVPDTEGNFESQGQATWTAQLHFSWDVVLGKLYEPFIEKDNNLRREAAQKSIDFSTFWSQVVEDSLFAPTSSKERKHWGLLLFGTILATAPQQAISASDVFSRNAVICMATALKGEDRYLQRTAQKAVHSLQARVSRSPTLVSVCLKGLIKGVKFDDFDVLSKTKVLEKLMAETGRSVEDGIRRAFSDLFSNAEGDTEDEVFRRRKNIIAVESRFLSQALSRAHGKYELDPLVLDTPLEILENWIQKTYFDYSIGLPLRNVIKSRLTVAFEQVLKTGAMGRRLLRQAIAKIHSWDKSGTSTVVTFESSIRSIVGKAWRRLASIPTNRDSPRNRVHFSRGDDADESSQSGQTEVEETYHENSNAVTVPPDGTISAFSEGLALLYSLTLFQVYSGEAEAVEILEDLLAYHGRIGGNGEVLDGQDGDDSDALVEILLTFASKPSKFMRRITIQIFEAFAPTITKTGLKSLARVLATKESIQGQQEMFIAENDNPESEQGSGGDSDVDMVDSDVELVSDASSTSEVSDNLVQKLNGEAGPSDGNDLDGNAELVAFDAKLAAALGTRKIDEETDTESSGPSDTDMDDDQMLKLDEKLVEVFRARKDISNKKKENELAKETIVNFKNRVLDLIEVYLKHEYLSPQSLELILPLLTTARKTTTKQIAARCCAILRDFCSRCKGQNVPAVGLKHEEAIKDTLQMLRAVHVEAGQEGSNAHAGGASAASILLVKVIVNGGADIATVVEIYQDTRKRWLTQKKCQIQPAFFTEWNNWCVSAREKLAK